MVKRIIKCRRHVSSSGAFTLVELLVVLCIVGILAALVAPSLQGVFRAGSFSREVNQLTDDILLARSYAMGQNTYTYVGLTQVDRTQNPNATPQTAGTGKVVVGIVATSDGTSSLSTSNMVQIRPPDILDLLYIDSPSTLPNPSSGGMARPIANVSNVEDPN